MPGAWAKTLYSRVASARLGLCETQAKPLLQADLKVNVLTPLLFRNYIYSYNYIGITYILFRNLLYIKRES